MLHEVVIREQHIGGKQLKLSSFFIPHHLRQSTEPQPGPSHEPDPQPGPSHEPKPQPDPSHEPDPQLGPSHEPHPQPGPSHEPHPKPGTSLLASTVVARWSCIRLVGRSSPRPGL